MKVYKGNIVNPINRLKTKVYHNSCLVVQDDKIIDMLEFEEFIKKYKDYELIDYTDCYISPGFIDNHLHAPQVNQRARYGENLLQWLEKYILHSEETFGHDNKAAEVIDACLDELIKNGTTTAVMYSSHHHKATDILFEKCASRGLKAFAGKVMIDFSLTGIPKDTTDKSLRDSWDLYKKWDGYDNNRLNYVFTPRFAPVCSENLLKELGKLVDKYNVRVQSHLAENKEETESVLEIFYGYESYTEVYYKTGILSPNTIMAHCIHLSEKEFEYLKQTNTKIAHCPSSNFFLKSGRFNFKKAEALGITLGLGSDVGAGPSFSLFDVMKSMNYMQPYHILPQKTYYYATLGNAELLGISDTTGNFEKNKDADFIVIDIKKNQKDFRYHSIEDLLAYFIYLGNPSFIKDVYVRGKKIN